MTSESIISIERSRSRSRSPSHEHRREVSRSRSRSPRSEPKQEQEQQQQRPSSEHEHWEEALEELIREGKVKRSDLQESTMQSLKDLPTDMANYVMSRLKLSRLERVHNINGFIATIIKRAQREGVDDTEGDLGMLPRTVERRLEGLIEQGALARTDVDKRIVGSLADLPPSQALQAVERFSTSDLTTVRSKTGFLLSIIARVTREAREAIEREIQASMQYAPPPPHGHPAAPYAPPPAYGYDPYRGGGYGHPPADTRYGYR